MSLFESTLLNLFYANHYSVGPSNASQWQHRRKEAAEQIKKLALAGSRTQVSATSGQLTKKSLSNNMSAIKGPHEGKATE